MQAHGVFRAMGALVLLATVGCGAQDENNFSNGVRETPTAGQVGSSAGTPFDATLVSPPDTALNVPVGSPIVIDFSLPAGIVRARLSGPGGDVSASLSCDQAALSCELVPGAPLVADTDYRVTVEAGSLAADGTVMARSRVWDFSTAQDPAARLSPLVPAHSAEGWLLGMRVEPLAGPVDVAFSGSAGADGPWSVSRATSLFSSPAALAPHQVHTLDASQNGTPAASARVAIGWAETTPAGLAVGLNDVAMLSTRLGVAVGDQGTVLVTEDGGDRWTTRHAGGADLRAVHMVAPDNGWAAGAAGTLLHTVDGTDWSPMPGLPAVNLNDVLFIGVASGFVVGDGGTVLATADGGGSWHSLAVPTSQNLNAIACDSATACTVVGARGTILATTDGGASWAIAPAVTRADLTGVTLLADGNGWITGKGGLLLAGGTGYGWTVYGTTGQAFLAGMAFADARHGWAAGTGNAVIATADGGSTFSALPLPEVLALSAIAPVDAARLVAVGRDGAGNGVIFRSDTGGASS